MNDTGKIKLIPTVSRGKLSSAQIRCAAADEIEKRGWTQGTFEDIDGSLCMAGAIYVVMYDDPDPMNFYKVPLKESFPVFEELQESIGDTAFWNDTDGRKKEEVIEVLRRDC